MPIIKLKNLTKKFGNFVAVDNISFEISEGEIFGFLGPNGAGKTTTLSMLSTILSPTSGNAEINGFDLVRGKDGIRRSIGMVFQDPSLDDELTAYENLVFHGVMYRIKKDIISKRIEEALSLVDLEKRKNDLVRTFSGGMKRRLEIARGLMHCPKILFLDEPTVGLDPQTRSSIWDYIRKLNRSNNTTIMLTTHYMEEAEKLSGRVAIIDHGRIVAIDAPNKLKELLGGDVISFVAKDSKALSNELARIKWIRRITQHDGHVNVNVSNSEEQMPMLLKIINSRNIEVQSISLNKPSLEDVFLHLTGKTIREEEASIKDSMRLHHRLWGR